MSRLQTDSMEVLAESADVGELVVEAVESLGPGASRCRHHPDRPARVHTDPVLVERAVANLIDNALNHAGGRGLRVEAGPVAGRVDIRVIDQGPGIPRRDRDTVFQPFQRLGDSENGTGVGLGLAVARGSSGRWAATSISRTPPGALHHGGAVAGGPPGRGGPLHPDGVAGDPAEVPGSDPEAGAPSGVPT